MAKSISGNKITVSGHETGALFPTNREECYKDIIVEGREKGNKFYLGGGAFSPNLQILGGGRVRGPVYASQNLRMENDGVNGPQCLLSGVTAYKSVMAIPSGETSLKDSLAYNMDKGLKFLIRGDVISKEKVSLRDTCVIGSIYAPDIKLQNSIILGLINAPDQIEVICSVIGMYKTSKIKFSGPNTIFMCGGISLEKPTFDTYPKVSEIERNIPEELEKTDGGDERDSNPPLYPFSLRYLPICRIPTVGCGMQAGKTVLNETEKKYGVGISCGTWMEQKCRLADKVKLGKFDFINLPGRVRIDENTGDFELDYIKKNDKKTTTMKGDQQDVWYLGISGRALNLKKLEEADKNFLRIIRGIFAFEHLEPDQREKEKKLWEKHLSKSEKDLFHIATKGLESQF